MVAVVKQAGRGIAARRLEAANGALPHRFAVADVQPSLDERSHTPVRY